MWRKRLAWLVAAGGFLAVALGIRALAAGQGVLDLVVAGRKRRWPSGAGHLDRPSD
jgi:hypothetical protein